MKITLLLAGALLALLGFVACGDDDDDTTITPAATTAPPEPERTVIINNTSYTCESITAADGDCGPESQAVFDAYSQNIDAFVNSGSLGPVFNASPYVDAAYAGIIACVYRARGEDENAFIDFLIEDNAFSQYASERTSFLPVWFEAADSLCPS